MKTLHFTNSWHARSGGIATFYRALLEAANARGHSMRLVVPGESDAVEEAGRFGRIYYIEAPRSPFNRDYRVILPHRYLLSDTAIWRILRAERPDLVEVCDKYSLVYLAGLLRRSWLMGLGCRPAVVGLSCERLDENVAAYLARGRLVRLACRFYMKWLYFAMFDHHIAVSDHTAKELRLAARGHMVRRGVWIRPMGVDCRRFSPSRRNPETRARLLQLAGGSERSVLLLYAGRLAPEKNLELLAETMGLLAGDASRDHRLLVAGEGMVRERLERACAAVAPGRVSFLGHINRREELADVYANADIFLHPNPREPFGIAPLEAMAAGLALVAPLSGGLTSYAGAQNAWLVDAHPDAFAGAVHRITADPEAAGFRRRNARATAEQHSWETMASAYLELYQALHRRSRGAGRELEESRPVSLPPRFYSTAGTRLGFEV